MKNIILYIITVIVWGSTWLAIKYQLGSVDPMVSVIYRFGLAAALLMLFCYVKGLNLKFSLKEHLFMALLGVLLFSVNYWLVYVAELYLTSGLVAVLFSSIVFLNIANGSIFLGSAVQKKMVAGAVLGIIGIIMIFMPEIKSFNLSDKGVFGLCIGFISVLLASFGNITSARNTKNNIPVIQANAFGMGYGAILLTVIALTLGKEFSFTATIPYVGSLFYLSVFGSIIAFGSYLTLIGSIGADKASYTIMIVPVVALILSSFFEGYAWNFSAVSGLFLVVGGNFLALSKRRLTSAGSLN
ncbi:MAG: DMT family transporter [Proteobacteria bacterium]|nr:DMT family transporter [Pseudomonadota bacterium]MBU1583232.1 DMT family transporter [Pseudomonadota bacterium]MBU2454454.1 DMT family transporter [Pseudomonadota bacterium]MBU2629812.1 DMT family transporter [Pseudomonadota bacterium]